MRDDLWTQPRVSIPGLAADEHVKRITDPATVVYSYTPGAAPTEFLRGCRRGGSSVDARRVARMCTCPPGAWTR
ncbi:MAG: hypothetical protein M5U19_05900 [Microthrixaceae bacterium]|nr:hypothetical protein [Microthrixaceae bacterium]